jgi:hypothetical protein
MFPRSGCNYSWFSQDLDVFFYFFTSIPTIDFLQKNKMVDTHFTFSSFLSEFCNSRMRMYFFSTEKRRMRETCSRTWEREGAVEWSSSYFWTMLAVRLHFFYICVGHSLLYLVAFIMVVQCIHTL